MSTFRANLLARQLFTTTKLSTKPHFAQQSIRHFSRTPAIMVKQGDSIPSIELTEGSPGDKVDLSKELASGQGLILGVPAAFSASHPTPSHFLTTSPFQPTLHVPNLMRKRPANLIVKYRPRLLRIPHPRLYRERQDQKHLKSLRSISE